MIFPLFSLRFFNCVMYFQAPVDVTINQIFFAIKTWSKNHEDRVPVIKRTWAKEVKHIRYYSDIDGNLLCLKN